MGRKKKSKKSPPLLMKDISEYDPHDQFLIREILRPMQTELLAKYIESFQCKVK